MNEQINIFDFDKQPFIIDKPIRLIELFAGYGSQHLSLKYLGADVESYKICEWAVKSIQAYKDLHFGDDNTDYSAELSKDDVIDYLYEKGISADYNKPMTREQIKRMGEAKCRNVYNNIKATHNLVSVTTAKGDDFDITDRDKFTYLLTYSFPCQDLSLAGQRKGMSKDSGTRSGLLWEVERILKELGKDRLPQVLLMENVPGVICDDFFKWCEFLNSLGYNSKYKIMNAKNYGISQNRERCFMVSILGDYFYTFPEEQKLELRLKDMLEDNVDEKYYLSDKMIEFFVNNNNKNIEKGNGFRFTPKEPEKIDYAKSITTLAGNRMDDNFIKISSIIDKDVSSTIRIGGRNSTDKNHCWDVVAEPVACEERTDEGLRFFSDDCMGALRTIDACGDKRGIEPIVNEEPLAYDEQNRYIRQDGCVGTLTTNGSSPKHNNRVIEPVSAAMRGRYNEGKTEQKIELNSSEFANAITTVQKDSMIAEPDVKVIGNYSLSGHEHLEPRVLGGIGNKCNNDTQYHQQNRIYDDDIAISVCTALNPYYIESGSKLLHNWYRIRKLTPKECFRLMGVKDEDFEKIAKNQSNSSLYHLAGDSIVTNCLMEIFRTMLRSYEQ